MTLRTREHVEAAAELDAAIEWYAGRRTLLAAEYLDAVLASLERILAWPDSGRPYPGREGRIPAVRTARVKGFPYGIVYLVEGGELVIFAYPHDRQSPGYWKHRIDG